MVLAFRTASAFSCYGVHVVIIAALARAVTAIVVEFKFGEIDLEWRVSANAKVHGGHNNPEQSMEETNLVKTEV